MTSFADAVKELNQNTNELKTMLCNVAANQKKLKYASSQFESFNRKFSETHSTEGTFDRNEVMALKAIIVQIGRLKNLIAHNFSQQWAQNTISSTSSSLASDICEIINKSREEAAKVDPENASIFDPSNKNWLKYHLLDLRTISSSFKNFLEKRKTEDQVSAAISARLKSINKFIEQYKDEDITPEGCVFTALPINCKAWKLEQTDFEKKEIVGTGASARVFKGIMKKEPYVGNLIAIKQLKPKELKGNKLRSFQREVRVLTIVDHPAVLKFYGATETFPYSIITEWMGGGDLYRALKTHSLDGTQLTICALDIARGMKYLHSQRIVHRDLKSLNILLDTDKHARICDLGFARVVEETSRDSIKTFVGTYYWMAPELLEEDPSYTPKVDVYSYAIMLWEMLAQKVPYNGEDPTSVIKKVYMNNARPKMPVDVDKSPGMQNLIEKCWDRDPNFRPSFEEIVRILASGEAYYQGADVNKVLEYAQNVLAQDDPDSFKTKELIEENAKSPITLEKFNETFKNMRIPQWYYESCWNICQTFIPKDFKDTNCNFQELGRGLSIFLLTTKNIEAANILTKFPDNSIPEDIMNEIIDSIPTGDDKLDEYFCTIACNNSKAEAAIVRVFPPIPSRATFNYITKNVDKIKLDYIDAITARVFVSLTMSNDIETAAIALECLDSIASYLNKQKTVSTDENDKKKYQNYVNRILSDSNVDVIVKFALSIGKSKTHKFGSKEKAALTSVSNYFEQMLINDFPFTKKQNVFDILLSNQASVDMITAILSPSLEINKITATNFIQWLSLQKNLQELSYDTFTLLIGKLKPHKEMYKDIKNIIGMAKSQFKSKSKDLKKLDHEFN